MDKLIVRVALYARVSTADKDQNPATQLLPLHEFVASQVRAGMDRARRQGKHVGRPQALDGDLDALRSQIEAGALSRRAAARQLGVSVSTVTRALSRKGVRSYDPPRR